MYRIQIKRLDSAITQRHFMIFPGDVGVDHQSLAKSDGSATRTGQYKNNSACVYGLQFSSFEKAGV